MLRTTIKKLVQIENTTDAKTFSGYHPLWTWVWLAKCCLSCCTTINSTLTKFSLISSLSFSSSRLCSSFFKLMILVEIIFALSYTKKSRTEHNFLLDLNLLLKLFTLKFLCISTCLISYWLLISNCLCSKSAAFIRRVNNMEMLLRVLFICSIAEKNSQNEIIEYFYLSVHSMSFNNFLFPHLLSVSQSPFSADFLWCHPCW